MRKPIRRLLAGLTLATAAATGSLTATGTAAAATQASTVSVTPDPGNTTDDTAWGTPPVDGPIVHTMDTAWG
ncbi:hypothetical protein ABZX39_33675 [Streptomyces collinus]|uniref:hypothetical protein n=1 Tax=Streptomyces collinus TaxID=42684 RepID=UPI00339F570A